MFTYFGNHSSEILGYLWNHVWLSVLPVIIGLVIALPLGWLVNRFRWAYPPVITIAGLLYTIPSLVLFVAMPGLLGTKVLSAINVVVALTIYAVALLVRVVADGLSSVPADAKQAATAMGYKPSGRFFGVELPLAVPVIAAGIRVATVSNVSLVAVSTFIGTLQLGTLFTDGLGLTVGRYWPILIGIILSVLLALVLDTIIVFAARWATPWRRVVR